MKTMISMLLYFHAAASVNVQNELFIHRCLESDVQQAEPSKSFSQQHFRGSGAVVLLPFECNQ